MRTSVIPINEYSENRFESDGSVSRVLLTYPKYHRHSDGSLHKTNCAIQESSDPDWDWEVEESIWSLYVKRDGTFRSVFHEQTITRKPVGIGFYNSDTKERDIIIGFDLTNWAVEVDGPSVTWTDPDTGFTFRVLCIHDQARSIVSIPQELQDVLAERLQVSWPREATCVGLIYDTDIDFLSEAEDVSERIEYSHTEGRGWRIRIGSRWVEHEKFESSIDVDADEKYLWRKRNIYDPEEKVFIEGCTVDALKSEAGELIFNTTDTFQQGVDGYSGCIDCYIRGWGNYKNTVYDGVGLQVSDDNSNSLQFRTLIAYNLTGLLGVPGTISRCQLFFWPYFIHVFGGGSFDIHAYQVLKPWVEDQTTWFSWDKGSALNWGAQGCENVCGSRTYNSSNGSGCDRISADTSTYIEEANEGSWWEITGVRTKNDMQSQWENGNWYGWILTGEDNSSFAHFRDSEYATVAQRPYLSLSWASSSSSSSASYSTSSSCSSSCSSCSSSSSFSSSSSCSSFSCSSSSWSGPFYVRDDAIGGNFGDADAPNRAFTIEEFRRFPAGPGTTMLIKGETYGHVGQYMPMGPIDWSALDGSYAEPITVKGFLTHPADRVRRPYQPNIIATGSSSSSSYSSSSSSSSS